MKVAVIILNYNSSSDCSKCIGFLKEQTGVQQEIVVVDNCSKDQDRQSLEAFITDFCANEATDDCKITYIANNKNTGYNAGNNIGLRDAASKGYEYALIANPDMEFPQKDYLQKMVETFDLDEDIVAVGSDVVGPNGDHQNPMKPDGGWTSSFDWVRDILKIGKKKGNTKDFIDNPSESHYCSKLGGFCLMVRLDFIKEIGFFDDYPFLYCEEAIFAKQVENSDKKMFYTKEAMAIHQHIASSKGDPRPRFRQWRRSRLYYIDTYAEETHFGKKMMFLSFRLYIQTMNFISFLKYGKEKK